jgi:hypothetical protein
VQGNPGGCTRASKYPNCSRFAEDALGGTHCQRTACADVVVQRDYASDETGSRRPGFARYGYPERLILLIAFLEIGCTILHVIPRTTVLGAILMTGYLGGATASNVRIGDPSFVITVILGILVWLGLYLRDQRLRPLIPLRN